MVRRHTDTESGLFVGVFGGGTLYGSPVIRRYVDVELEPFVGTPGSGRLYRGPICSSVRLCRTWILYRCTRQGPFVQEFGGLVDTRVRGPDSLKGQPTRTVRVEIRPTRYRTWTRTDFIVEILGIGVGVQPTG